MANENGQPGVTDESLLVIDISKNGDDSSQKAGGTDGQLVLDDVEFGKSRDNTMVHGIGNRTPQGVQRGNITYEVSASAHFNDTAADLAKSLGPTDVLTGELYFRKDASSSFNVNFTALDWNDCSIEASDDGDVVMSVTFDARIPTGSLAGDDEIGGGEGSGNGSGVNTN
jgi:hypothetical protein